MNSAGVRDPEDPDRWLVAPWPADASLDDVVGHFARVSAQFHPGTIIACRLAFHEGLQAALAAIPIEEFTDRDQRDYILNCADLGVSIFRDQYVAQYGHDPQVGEDQHLQAVRHRHHPQPPGP